MTFLLLYNHLTALSFLCYKIHGTTNCLVSKEKFRCYEAKIEEREKAGSHRESNPGHLACAASALVLSYDNRTTTIQPPEDHQ